MSIPIGIGNRSFVVALAAMKKDPLRMLGSYFTAFVIPPTSEKISRGTSPTKDKCSSKVTTKYGREHTD